MMISGGYQRSGYGRMTIAKLLAVVTRNNIFQFVQVYLDPLLEVTASVIM